MHWNNPIPVVAGLVQLSDSYVLVRNAGWPASVFSLLTGFLENGESPTSAVVREAHDRATGKLVLGDEIAEVKLVSPTELASFDFGPLRLSCEIVSCWLKDGCGASAEQTVAPDRDTSVVDAL